MVQEIFLHLFNMICLNSYILNKEHCNDKMSHANFREYIAQYLITTSLPSATAKCQRAQASPMIDKGSLNSKQFPKKFPSTSHTIRKHQSKRCKICNFTQQQRSHYDMQGPSLQVRYTTFTFNKCNGIPMCVSPSFELFHTVLHCHKAAL